MNKQTKIYFSIFLLFIVSFSWIGFIKHKTNKEVSSMTATVLSTSDNTITIQDKKNIIYTFKTMDTFVDIGSNVAIKYSGILDKSKEFQSSSIVSYKLSNRETDENGIFKDWLDNGIFSNYYILANRKLETMTLDEKIGQLFLVRYPDLKAIEGIKKYQFGGYLFFEKDFKDKTTLEVQNMIKSVQNVSKIPLLVAVDEEGGKVVRVSSNSKLVDSRFKSSQELYNLGGFDLIKEDTVNKSTVLSNLGINLNLAPVVDVSTNPSDYIYERSLGQNTELTSAYSKTVIEASKGGNVSYTLKHFPGYRDNSDTHIGSSIDNRTLEDIKRNDLPPFESGIKSGAEAVLISHNTVTNIDSNNPSSLSPSIHNLLRNNLNFTGIIISDNLDMKAVSSIDGVAIKAILAGNDVIITSDYEKDIGAVKQAIKDGIISEELINKLAFRVLAWKYYKGLMFINQK